MTQASKSGEHQIKAFRNSLTEILESEDLPLGVVGDLSDLLDTLRHAVNLLTGLMELNRSFERDPAAKLQELEIILGDDVRMILRDLLPSLRKMTKRAYSMRGKSSDKGKAKRLSKKS